MSKNSYDKFFKRLQSETLYFKYEFEDAVIKSVPKQGCFVKFKGSQEFKAKKGSGIVVEGVYEQNEISEEEYKSF